MRLCRDCKHFRENVHSDTTCRRSTKEAIDLVSGITVISGAKSAQAERASWRLPFRCGPVGMYWEPK